MIFKMKPFNEILSRFQKGCEKTQWKIKYCYVETTIISQN